MVKENAVVAVYDNHLKAEEAVQELRRGNFDMKKLSIVGKDCHTEEHVAGYYNAGDRMQDKISATLDKGILQIVAAKAQAAPKGRTIPVAAQASAAG